MSRHLQRPRKAGNLTQILPEAFRPGSSFQNQGPSTVSHHPALLLRQKHVFEGTGKDAWTQDSGAHEFNGTFSSTVSARPA